MQTVLPDHWAVAIVCVVLGNTLGKLLLSGVDPEHGGMGIAARLLMLGLLGVYVFRAGMRTQSLQEVAGSPEALGIAGGCVVIGLLLGAVRLG